MMGSTHNPTPHLLAVTVETYSSMSPVFAELPAMMYLYSLESHIF
jgi:hypothetical protein